MFIFHKLSMLCFFVFSDSYSFHEGLITFLTILHWFSSNFILFTGFVVDLHYQYYVGSELPENSKALDYILKISLPNLNLDTLCCLR